MTFKPWKRDLQMVHELGAGWHQHGRAVQAAHMIVSLSGSQLIQFPNADPQQIGTLLERIVETSAFLQHVGEVLEQSKLILLAASVGGLAPEPTDAQHEVERLLGVVRRGRR
jgi:hypothetical protein